MQDPNANLREKTEAVVGELLPVAFAALAAHHAIKSPRIAPRGVPPPLDTAQGGWQPVGPLALAPEKPAGPRRVRIEFETATGHPGTLEVNGPDVSEDSALAEIAAKHPGAITKRVESWPIIGTFDNQRDLASLVIPDEGQAKDVTAGQRSDKAAEFAPPNNPNLPLQAVLPDPISIPTAVNDSEKSIAGGQPPATEEIHASTKTKGDIARKVGEDRETWVAQYLGGKVSREIIIHPIYGRTDVDVVTANGDLVSVGGPAKANKIQALQRSLKVYKNTAAIRGVKAMAYFEAGTPDKVIATARQVLGNDNVKIFQR